MASHPSSKPLGGRAKAPSRRSHKKSRTGCDQCKERRVKCDETRPQCTNCAYRVLECSYLKLPPGPTSVSPPSDAVPSGPVHSVPSEEHAESHVHNEHPPSHLETASLKYSVRDLELMHKFSTETYKSLCGDESDMQDWQCLIPQHAYTYEFLLRAMLALAALHITATTTNSERALSFLDTALQYNNLSFGPFRDALNNLNPQNCDAVYASSAIITVLGISMPYLDSKYRGGHLSMVDTMTTAFDLLQGAYSISCISEPWLQAGIFSKYGFWEMQMAELYEDTTNAIERLIQLNHPTREVNDAKRHTNRETIEFLRSCFAKFTHSPHPAPILGWLLYAKKDFVDRLRSRRPLELLVFMHWGVLLNELGGHFWWARGSGKALVVELLSELTPSDGDTRWNQALRWPQGKVGA